jgi:hypothetical protein
VKFFELIDTPELSKYTKLLLQQRFYRLKRRYLKSNSEPRKFKTLLKALLETAQQMDDKPRKRTIQRTPEEKAAAKKAQTDSSKVKSAEFVSSSDEEGHEEA